MVRVGAFAYEVMTAPFVVSLLLMMGFSLRCGCP
jgi:hypothetical protein